MGLFCGPLTLASHLAGVRIFTDVYKNKEFAAEVCKFAGEVGAKSAEFYAEMGCDIIANVDPVASQIKPETFREYVTPNSQAANKIIHDAGITSSFFICGDATKVMEEVCKMGTHGFAIDEQMNMNFIRDLARKYGVGFRRQPEIDAGAEPGPAFFQGGCHCQPCRGRSARIHFRTWVRHALRCSGGTYGSGNRSPRLV
jgi:hypothetical protein